MKTEFKMGWRQLLGLVLFPIFCVGCATPTIRLEVVTYASDGHTTGTLARATASGHQLWLEDSTVQVVTPQSAVSYSGTKQGVWTMGTILGGAAILKGIAPTTAAIAAPVAATGYGINRFSHPASAPVMIKPNKDGS